jgi:hypothetical protein
VGLVKALVSKLNPVKSTGIGKDGLADSIERVAAVFPVLISALLLLVTETDLRQDKARIIIPGIIIFIAWQIILFITILTHCDWTCPLFEYLSYAKIRPRPNAVY